MFIHTEATPNPETLKFLPDETVTGGAGVEFTSVKEAVGRSPLAERLFEIDGVASVFLGEDFVSVTKVKEEDWTAIKTLVLGVLFEHFSMKQPVLISPASSVGNDYSGDDEVVRKIRTFLDTRVRPAVARDGGDVEFCGFENGVLWLKLRGACAGCPSATITLKMGVERIMREEIPEVQEVRAVQGEKFTRGS